ncbi:MAG: acyltransferase family protein [Methylocella sp.]
MRIQTDLHLKSKSNQIYGLDFIRFAAALLVAVYHFAFTNWVLPDGDLHAFLPATPGLPPGYRFTWVGWIGVEIFFALSGFVIAYSCHTETTRTFIIKRFLRLTPAMWISATICGVLSVWLGFNTFSKASLLTLKSAVFFPVGPLIASQMWTLPIEISFYAVLAIMLAVGWKESLERLAIVLALCSGAYWITESFGFRYLHPRLTQLLLLEHGCHFALGLLLWCAVKDRLTPQRLVMMTVCVATGFLQIGNTAVSEIPYGDRLPLAVPIGVWLTAVALIYLSARYNIQADHYLAPHKKLVRQIGLLTYPLYLIHKHVGGAVLFLAHRASIGFASAVVLALLASIAFSWLVTVFPEPALKRLLASCITPNSGRARKPLASVE